MNYGDPNVVWIFSIGKKTANTVNVIITAMRKVSNTENNRPLFPGQGVRMLIIERITRTKEIPIDINTEFGTTILVISGNSIGFPVLGSMIASKISENFGIM
jgi:hypothetical protein